MRILVVEDERHLNDMLVKRLKEDHYSVDGCFDGEEAMNFLRGAEYDAVILDIMMPKKDGRTVLREMRSIGLSVPVLFLTAKDSVSDRVKGLDDGADDYLVKPFSFDELLARLRVMTRRSTNHVSNCFTAADLTLDCEKREVSRGGIPIALSAREFEILEYMIRNQGVVLSRDKMEQHIWNYDYEGGSNIIDVYIRYLRKKIDDGFDLKLIHTMRGSGYVLKVPE